jgi:predicted RNA binding protein YcfA (HicA-like mRNA interferase family)
MPGEVRFSRVSKMLEAKGYRLTRVSGSHHVFTKAGVRSVKPAYVRMIQKLEA